MNRRTKKKQLKNRLFTSFVKRRINMILGGVQLPYNIFNFLRRSQLKKTIPFFLVPLDLNDRKYIGINTWVKAPLPYEKKFSILPIKKYLKSLSKITLNPPNLLTNQSPAVLGLEDNLNEMSSESAGTFLSETSTSASNYIQEESLQENLSQQMKQQAVQTSLSLISRLKRNSGSNLNATKVEN